MKIFIVLALFCSSMSCISGKARPSSDGKIVPSRPFLEFSHYDYFCDSMSETNPQRIEEYLQNFGDEGWEVATTIIRDGQTVAICFQR